MGITRRRSTLFKLPSNVFSYRLGDRRTFQACTLLLIEGFDIGECPEFILQGNLHLSGERCLEPLFRIIKIRRVST